MDDHDGTGIPGEDSGTDGTAAQATPPAGRQRPARKKPAASAPQEGEAASAELMGGQEAQGAKGAEGDAGEAAEAAAPAAKKTAGPAARTTKASTTRKAPAPAAKKTTATAAAKSTTAKSTAAKSTAAKPASAKSTAGEASPATSTPAKATTSKAATTKSAAAKTTPAKAAASTSAAAKKTAAKKAPAKTATASKATTASKTAKTAKTAAATKAAASAKAAGAKAATAAGSTASGDSAVWQAPGYRHERELGTGTNGRVVSALHEGTSVAVTVTYLSAALAEDDAFRAEFRADAEALGALAAPHVAQLHAYVEDGPHAAIVREPVDGVSLDALLGVTGALSPEASLTAFKGSLLALDAAHEAGVLHRAYRPENVLVTADGSLKVVDFGVAPRGGAGGAAAGQDAYTAPERVAGGPATVAADLYAATAVLRECLTGAAATAPAAESRLPETVRPLIAWGWAGNPAERPESAADFAAELETAAVAAYGADWEERGRSELVTLVAPLLAAGVSGAAGGAVATEAPAGAQPPAAPVAAPVPPSVLPGAGFGGGAGKSAAQETRPRFGRRAKILAVAVAAVVVAGAVAITAAASGNDKDSAAPASPAPGSSTSLTSAPAAPSATATTAPASPTAGSSASATASATAPAAGTASPSRTATADPTGSATSSPSATTTPSSTVSPTATSGSAAGPHVTSVAVTGFTCSSGSHRTASATVLVQYDGTAAGTLHLTWWRSATGSPQGAVMRPQQTTHFPKGSQSYTFTDSFTFSPDSAHPYVGLSVSTDPGAASGNGTYKVGCH